jgi:hypothetical protein
MSTKTTGRGAAGMCHRPEGPGGPQVRLHIAFEQTTQRGWRQRRKFPQRRLTDMMGYYASWGTCPARLSAGAGRQSRADRTPTATAPRGAAQSFDAPRNDALPAAGPRRSRR